MANTRKRKQKQTLKEFRAWLQGVEELQPENWAPNRDQWQLIRGKIDGIVEEKKVVETVTQQPIPQQPIQRPAATPQIHPGFVPPPEAGGVPAAEVEMTPEARAMLNPAAGVKSKTPDIDTSDGNVTSSFA